MALDIKSSITLPAAEFATVLRLRKQTGAASNVEVVRVALRLLDREIERETLRRAYADASHRVRECNREDMAELDALADEGIDR